MKIAKAYILADKAHSAPVPEPITPVEASLAVTGNIDIYYHMTNSNLNPPASRDISTVRGWQRASYYEDTTGKQIPSNFGVGVVGGEVTLRLYDYSSEFSNAITDCYLYNLNGSFTLTVGNQLAPGNYVFECIWYIGPYGRTLWDTGIYEYQVAVVNGKQVSIKSGTHGIVEAILDSTVVTYQGKDYGLGGGRVVKITTRYAFTIEQGDTTKVFTFGPNKDFDFQDIWDSLHMWNVYRDGSRLTDQFMDTDMLMMAQIYTAR